MDNLAPDEPPQNSPEVKRSLRRWLWVVDAILFLVLALAAFPVRMQNAAGDLWGDEGDYALASAKSFHSNRWDLSDDPKKPLALIELRHYHPPLLAYSLKIAHKYGSEEQTLRFPVVIAGCVTIGLVYLCGVTLYAGRREIAIGVALIALQMPLHIRSSSHAIPWSFIGMFFILLTWTMLKYVETKRVGWLTANVVVLGLLFTHSEMFYPAVVMVLLASPFLFWPDINDKARLNSILKSVGIGAVIALILIATLWPVGLLGGSFRMLSHYVKVSKALIPVTISGVEYAIAPKWAYAFWLWKDFRPYALLYLCGFVALILLLAFRKGTRPIGIVVGANLLLLAVAHRAHIIGPEYLAHVTPCLALIAGLGFQALIEFWRPLGWTALIYSLGGVFYWHPLKEITDSDSPILIPRWKSAAAYLNAHWKPGDTLVIGPQTVGVARWYVRYVANIEAEDSHIQPLQLIKPGHNMLANLSTGQIRYVMISSVFVANPTLDTNLRTVLKNWPIVYQSDENTDTVPRLKLYEVPLGVSKQNPIPLPNLPGAPTISPSNLLTLPKKL